ncbi:hypothetical protein ABT160_03995 [Streptomyces sp. NPDC001941]|uniref:hypothetical protein n=1 Tax=Streptomyces sp. NPDC001941 TaxID=3154659 RepID=UPI003320E56F
MNLAPALRAALVTVAIAGATLFGTQIAQADGPAPTGVTNPAPAAPAQVTPSPSASTDTNPWD